MTVRLSRVFLDELGLPEPGAYVRTSARFPRSRVLRVIRLPSRESVRVRIALRLRGAGSERSHACSRDEWCASSTGAPGLVPRPPDRPSPEALT